MRFGVLFWYLSGSFWNLGSTFGPSRDTWGRPRDHLRAHVWILHDFEWILGSLMAPNLDAFSSIWVIWGIKVVSRIFDLFRRGLGMCWNLQKFGFTIVKQIFSQIPLTDSGVTFWCHLHHFWAAVEALWEYFCASWAY